MSPAAMSSAAAGGEAARETEPGRLLFIGEELPRLRAGLSGALAPRYDRLRDEYKRLRTKALSVEAPAESTTYVGIHAMNLALLTLLSDEDEHLEEARRWIDAAVGWKDWGHAFLVNVDLSAAWLLWGLGLAYAWIGERLPLLEREALRDKLLRQGRLMFEYKLKTEGEGWSTNWWQNHNWINLNGLACAGYALREGAEAEAALGGDLKPGEALAAEAETWIRSARDNFRLVFDGLADDGSDYEGVAYWRYGVPWLFAYAHMERERGGADWFAASGFLRNTARWRLYNAAPNHEETCDFGDCHDTRSAHSIAIYYKAAAEFGDGTARWLADRVETFRRREQWESGVKPGILSEAGLEMLWFDPNVAPVPPDGLPTCAFYPDQGLLSWRSSWAMDATLLAVQLGAPGGAKQWERSWAVEREKGWKVRGLSHRHPDDGSFILWSKGSYLAKDEGYSRELFAAHHNLVVVDGKGYRGEGQNNIWKDVPEDGAAVLEYCGLDPEPRGGPGFFAFSGDTARCYSDELGVKRSTRLIAGGEGGAFVIVDECEADADRVFSWLMHAECHPRSSGGERLGAEGSAPSLITWAEHRAALDLFRVAPEAAQARTYPVVVRAIMTPQEPTIFRESRRTCLALDAARGRSARFVQVLAPRGKDEPAIVSVEALPCRSGLGFRIRSSAGEQSWYLAPFPRIPGAAIDAEGLKTDADWVQILVAAGKPARLRAGGGTYIEASGFGSRELSGGFHAS